MAPADPLIARGDLPSGGAKTQGGDDVLIDAWRRTLMFLFYAVAETRPQVALDAIRQELLPRLELEDVRHDSIPALLLLDCLYIAHARRWAISDFAQTLWRSCEQ